MGSHISIPAGALEKKLMASFTQPFSFRQFLGCGLTVLGVVLSSQPGLAQLPELPPAPSAPPAVEPASDALSSPDADEASDAVEELETTFIRPQALCPDDLDTLSTLLVRDIPSYTNRILQSSVADISTAYRPAYVIIASQPEQTPLEIKDRVYTTQPDSIQQLQQLFFTTLERQYSGLEATSISHFHWLFLAPDKNGWQMVFMLSTIDAENEVMLPPRDSSQGSVGQAVQRWLGDCRSGAIFLE